MSAESLLEELDWEEEWVNIAESGIFPPIGKAYEEFEVGTIHLSPTGILLRTDGDDGYFTEPESGTTYRILHCYIVAVSHPSCAEYVGTNIVAAVAEPSDDEVIGFELLARSLA